MAGLGGLFGGAMQPLIKEDEYEKIKWQNELMNAKMAIASGHISGSQLAGILGSQQAPTPVKELDTLYWNGSKLPDDWRGSEMTSFRRDYVSGLNRYVLTFTSKWGGGDITLFLDADKYSGAEADKIGETYREALNQRRVG